MNLCEIEKTITLINGSKSKICVFLGAGVDVSSGGLLFNALKNSVIEKFSDFSPSALDENDRNSLFEKLIDSNPNYNSREILLNNFSGNNFTISDGYRILLLMAQYGIVDAIISTNFFDYLERNQTDMNVNAIDTYINEYNNLIPAHDKKSVFLKLHGDANKYIITHVTEEEINNKDYSSQTIDIFKYYLRDHSLVFIGYSGNDTKINEIIKNNIDGIDCAFFVNVKYSKSKLTELLENNDKFLFCNASFDKFMTQWGISRLSGIKIFDTYPLLIESLLDARAEQSTAELLKDTSIYIERPEADEMLQSFCHTAFIYGTAGIGKTFLIKHYISTLRKSQSIYIDLKYIENVNVISEVASVLGFSSDVPVALLHKLCSWYEKKQKYITFIIDGIADYNSYIDEILLLAKLNEKNEYVSFVFSSRKQYFNTVCEIENSSENTITLEKFSDEDVLTMIDYYDLNAEFFHSYKILMREPYICSIICDFYKNTTLEFNVNNVFEIIESTLEKNFKIQSSKIRKCFMEAAVSLPTALSRSSEEIYKKLFPCGLLCTPPNYQLKYNKLTEYYYYVYSSRTEHEKKKYISKLQELLSNRISFSRMEYMAFQYIYTLVNEVDEIQNSILKLDQLLIKCGEKNPTLCAKFVCDCLLTILQSYESKYVKSIINISISLLSNKMKFLIVTTAHFLSSNSSISSIWRWAYSEENLRYRIFIYCMDKICTQLKSISSEEEISKYLEKNDFIFSSDCNMEDIVPFLYILMRLDITDKFTKQVRKFAIRKMKTLLKLDSRRCQDRVISILKKYSYNILFNSDSDIDADYNSIMYNKQIHTIINDVVNGKTISCYQLHYLMQSGDILNNMILFMLCNLIVVCSALNNKTATLTNIISIIDENLDYLPEDIDFILSCVFMSLYQCNPIERKEFVDVFNKICEKYEILLFEQPSKTRKSTNRKFAEQFEVIFEDGFNPTAFLFYTAPIDKSGNALVKYDELCNALVESGNYDKILKIVHAIGQMISVYPDEGLIELKKLLKYDEKIVRRGIIRILTENYQRYPKETLNFINENMELTSIEEELIFGSTTEFLERRTLEQLHWSRLIYSVSIYNRRFIKKLLNCFSTQKNLSQFIVQVLSEENAEIEHQTD